MGGKTTITTMTIGIQILVKNLLRKSGKKIIKKTFGYKLLKKTFGYKFLKKSWNTNYLKNQNGRRVYIKYNKELKSSQLSTLYKT